jgi:hypothetical protein
MPNTPALIGQGVAGVYARPRFAATRQRAVDGAGADRTAGLARRGGALDAVTALSGSGRPMCSISIEAMLAAGRRWAQADDEARALALQTVAGARRSPRPRARARALRGTSRRRAARPTRAMTRSRRTASSRRSIGRPARARAGPRSSATSSDAAAYARRDAIGRAAAHAGDSARRRQSHGLGPPGRTFDRCRRHPTTGSPMSYLSYVTPTATSPWHTYLRRSIACCLPRPAGALVGER